MERRTFASVLPAWALGLAAFTAGLTTSTPVPAQQAVPPARTWFIFLETGRPTPEDRAAVAAMQRGHIDNFKRLFAAGQLFAAGPLRDPTGVKRGIVTVQARHRDELMSYFQPDAYVREGYMTVNAQPALPRRALHTEGIDASRVEEVRIIQIPRDAAPVDPALDAARTVWLQGQVNAGRVQAWYTLDAGPVAEVLFARSTDTAGLQAAFADYPAARGAGPAPAVTVWGQWISPGVVR